MSIENERLRCAILERTALSAWGSDARKACEPRNGETLRAASMSDTQAVLVFTTRYGKIGTRTVVLASDDKDTNFSLVADAFAEAPKEEKVTPTVARYRATNVLEAIELPLYYKVVTSSGEVIADNLKSITWASRIAAGLAEFNTRVVTMQGSKAVCWVAADGSEKILS